MLANVVVLLVATLAHAAGIMGQVRVFACSRSLVLAVPVVTCLVHHFGVVRLVQMLAGELDLRRSMTWSMLYESCVFLLNCANGQMLGYQELHHSYRVMLILNRTLWRYKGLKMTHSVLLNFYVDVSRIGGLFF